MTPGPNPALLIALAAMALAACASKPPAGLKAPNSQLEYCQRTLGSLAFGKQVEPSSTLPLLRLMVRASNCFTLAGGAASAPGARPPIAADYTATASLSFGDDGAAPIGSLREPALQPSTVLTLTDNRSGAELAMAQGSASHWRFGAAGGFFNGGFAGADGYTRSAQDKLLAAAMLDAYNQVVRSLKRRAALSGTARLRPVQLARQDPPRSR
jgi:hypothetical protein